ncbi:unnamed protein product [Diatraea saccharalis]|uniref:Uncharacterized protein n=1 Tax=Diatraea saccharalis TaxID=40085 RepID=A0A9N9RFC7_9NEOP|nr:unnamed protein product [Diatraea saccharalis]
MAVPTVTIDELSNAIMDPTINATPKKVLEGILNDHMDLYYGNETPFTTGKTVLPMDTTIQDVDNAAADLGVEKKFRDIFSKISEVYKSGNLTPQSVNYGWDPKLKPVLVVVTQNKF